MQYKELIDKLSLEEKASLMSGKDFWQSQNIDRLGIKSMFLADGPHGIRKQAVAADHLGLNPSIPATCFPTAATVANSWNIELGEKIGKALGHEAVSQKVNVLLGPGVNIKRNPLCGRNFEYFSEDPYLAGKMAAAYIRGIQSNGISACVKHFAVNNQEAARMSIDTIVDERALREIYLTAFEIAVIEGGTRTLMSSYNRINGTYANENIHTMQDILRKEWGYTGCVVTDWGGGNDRVDGLIAGNELEMPTTGGETDRDIIKAVKSGKLDESVLDECVDRLLNLIFITDKAVSNSTDIVDPLYNHNLAAEAAEESIVLLKNSDGILPLGKDRTVAIIGDFAETPRYQGAGSSIVNPTKLDATLGCLYEYGLNSIGFEPGFDRYGRKNGKYLKRACELAAKADAVLLYLGLDEVSEVEGLDRSHLSLPENQIALLEAVAEVNSEIIVVLSCGSAVEMPWLDKVKGLLHGYLSGQAGARAMLRVISGDVNPSGKLAETYPLRYEDTPSANHFPGREATVEYRESLYIGYRYFDTARKEVLFPFGFGLSYTSFEYSGIKADRSGVSFTITNTGDKAGMETAQMYVSRSPEAVFRPEKELKGFCKVFINPGESKNVRIDFDDKSFRYFNVKTGSWEVEQGEYGILIGASSRDIRLKASVSIDGTGAPAPYDRDSLPSYFSCSVQDVEAPEYEKLLGRPLPPPEWDRSKPLGYTDTIAQCRYARGGFARFAHRMVLFAYWFLRKIGKRSTANLIMMSVYNMPFRGIARMTGGLINMPMVDGLLMIVNGHFFKGLFKFIGESKKIKIMESNGKYYTIKEDINMKNKFSQLKAVSAVSGLWKSFKEKHPGIAQFLVFFILSNGVTLLQMLLMPALKAAFMYTPLVHTNFQIFQMGTNFDGSLYYMFNYAAGPLSAGGGGGLAYFLAVQITLGIAQVINFFAQRNITFKSNGNIWMSAMWYVIAYIVITFGAAAAQGIYKAPIYNLLINTWGLGSFGETLADFVTMIIYSAISFWVFFPIFKIIFRQKPENEPQGEA